MAADRDGNGWWAQIALDIVATSDRACGKGVAVEIPPLAAEKAGITAEEKDLYDNCTQLDLNTPCPSGEGPRRMGGDKHGDVLWVCEFWGR